VNALLFFFLALTQRRFHRLCLRLVAVDEELVGQNLPVSEGPSSYIPTSSAFAVFISGFSSSFFFFFFSSFFFPSSFSSFFSSFFFPSSFYSFTAIEKSYVLPQILVFSDTK